MIDKIKTYLSKAQQFFSKPSLYSMFTKMVRSIRTPAVFLIFLYLSPVNAQDTQQQMLDQIKQLQQEQIAKQQKQIQQLGNVQAVTSVPTTASPTTDVQGQTSPVTVVAPTKPRPHFEIPFPSAEVAIPPIEKELESQAFGSAAKGLLPMTPEQIHRLKQIYTNSQYAAAAPAGTPPEPTATSLFVNLSPGATPPVIRLTQGFVSSLVFLDATGAPWPIAAYDIGNPSAFDIQWDKKDNVLMIQAKTLYTYGNLAIRLRDLNTPVMLTLIPGQKIVDYRVDITIPSYGPEAKALPMQGMLPGAENPELLGVLDGIPPNGSRELIVASSIGQAWLLGENIFVRTRYTLLSPGWISTMSSADGTHAYQLQKTPMLLMAQNGKVIHVKVEGF